MGQTLEQKLAFIKEWLGTGSINVFGLPMSGKDTVGIKLAESIGARFLSSGMIIRAMEQEKNEHYTDAGALAPTDIFYEWVLPYFGREDLKNSALVLSSVGRWSGEETKVIDSAAEAGHPIKAAVLLNISEADVEARWEVVRDAGAREAGQESTKREDDKSRGVFGTRIKEFIEKTMPVIQHYQSLGLLIQVRADMTREEVFAELVDRLYEFAKIHH
ncbi:nucleoside monophosphate kinase [Candidatus Saccharibacteria bacterium]|nr:nucleoside monophosphate kinase [Candidatus Saccharibacteria bacterium]